jgi:hypothetical protein
MFKLNGAKDLNQFYGQTQRDTLELNESKHDRLPPRMALAITVLFGSVEFGTVFFLMLLKVGVFGALITASLPIAFLSSIAYFYALIFERPERFKEVMEQYEPQFLLRPAFQSQMFPLVPNQSEYEGQKTDAYLQWMAVPNSNSPIRSAAMLHHKFDENFFGQRSPDMDNECLDHIEAREIKYRHQVELLDQEPCPLSTSNLPPQQIQEQSARWYIAQLEQLQEHRDIDLRIIQERHRVMKQQCHSKVEIARQEYQAAQQAWRNFGYNGEDRIAE